MKEMKADLEEKEKRLKTSQEIMIDALKEAKKATGLAKGAKDRPPQEIEEYWTKVSLMVFRVLF